MNEQDDMEAMHYECRGFSNRPAFQLMRRTRHAQNRISSRCCRTEIPFWAGPRGARINGREQRGTTAMVTLIRIAKAE